MPLQYNFDTGLTLVPFDFTPYLSYDINHYQFDKTGNIDTHVTFALPCALTMVGYAEYENVAGLV